MTKPEGISQSAWDEAEVEASVYLVWLGPDATKHEADAHHVLTYSIARAIDAATERAALIADGCAAENNTGSGFDSHPAYVTAYRIASAIRQGSQPSNVIPHRGEIA